jgi:hypothetical protein
MHFTLRQSDLDAVDAQGELQAVPQTQLFENG